MAKTTLITRSGSGVDYLKPENIDLADIAAGLSQQPRFAGQTRIPFSVAQHCLLVARLCPMQRAHALIHDAQEALLGDLPTQAKEAMRKLSKGKSPYDELEKRLHAAIAKAVGLEPEIPVSVHIADMAARQIEGRLLHHSANWPKDPEQKISDLEADYIIGLPDGGRELWLLEVLQEKARIQSYWQFRAEKRAAYEARGA